METVKKTKPAKKAEQQKTPIQKLFGCLKGKMEYSDQIFNLAVK